MSSSRWAHFANGTWEQMPARGDYLVTTGSKIDLGGNGPATRVAVVFRITAVATGRSRTIYTFERVDAAEDDGRVFEFVRATHFTREFLRPQRFARSEPVL